MTGVAEHDKYNALCTQLTAAFGIIQGHLNEHATRIGEAEGNIDRVTGNIGHFDEADHAETVAGFTRRVFEIDARYDEFKEQVAEIFQKIDEFGGKRFDNIDERIRQLEALSEGHVDYTARIDKDNNEAKAALAEAVASAEGRLGDHDAKLYNATRDVERIDGETKRARQTMDEFIAKTGRQISDLTVKVAKGHAAATWAASPAATSAERAVLMRNAPRLTRSSCWRPFLVTNSE